MRLGGEGIRPDARTRGPARRAGRVRGRPLPDGDPRPHPPRLGGDTRRPRLERARLVVVILISGLAGLLVAAAVRLPGHGGHSPRKVSERTPSLRSRSPAFSPPHSSTLGLGLVLCPEAPLIASGSVSVRSGSADSAGGYGSPTPCPRGCIRSGGRSLRGTVDRSLSPVRGDGRRRRSPPSRSGARSSRGSWPPRPERSSSRGSRAGADCTRRVSRSLRSHRTRACASPTSPGACWSPPSCPWSSSPSGKWRTASRRSRPLAPSRC